MIGINMTTGMKELEARAKHGCEILASRGIPTQVVGSENVLLPLPLRAAFPIEKEDVCSQV